MVNICENICGYMSIVCVDMVGMSWWLVCLWWGMLSGVLHPCCRFVESELRSFVEVSRLRSAADELSWAFALFGFCRRVVGSQALFSALTSFPVMVVGCASGRSCVLSCVSAILWIRRYFVCVCVVDVGSFIGVLLSSVSQVHCVDFVLRFELTANV